MNTKTKSFVAVSMPSSREHGFVLGTVLIFMVILMMLGLASMRDSTLQERMAGNLRDRNLALQAAELAMRDAERDVAAVRASTGSFGTTRPAGERGGTAAQQAEWWYRNPILMQTWTPDCSRGQCWSVDSTAATKPVWENADWGDQDGSTGTNPTVQYGQYTGAPAIAGLAAQPRYIMELFVPSQNDVSGVESQRVVIRITARAVGQNKNTVVMLQSVIFP